MSFAVLSIFFFTFSAIPNEAQALPGKRVCVSENGQYAILINRGPHNKRFCQGDRAAEEPSEVSTERLSSANRERFGSDFGYGDYETCEEFARDYLKWAHGNPCVSMNLVSRNYLTEKRWLPNDDQIHLVGPVPFDHSVKEGERCVTAVCNYTWSFAESRTFTYSANVGFEILGAKGNLGFAYAKGETWGSGVIIGWAEGLIPGLAIRTDLNRNDYRQVSDFSDSAFQPHSKDFAVSNDEYEVETRFLCTPAVMPNNWTGSEYIDVANKVGRGQATQQYLAAVQLYIDQGYVRTFRDDQQKTCEIEVFRASERYKWRTEEPVLWSVRTRRGDYIQR